MMVNRLAFCVPDDAECLISFAETVELKINSGLYFHRNMLKIMIYCVVRAWRFFGEVRVWMYGAGRICLVVMA